MKTTDRVGERNEPSHDRRSEEVGGACAAGVEELEEDELSPPFLKSNFLKDETECPITVLVF